MMRCEKPNWGMSSKPKGKRQRRWRRLPHGMSRFWRLWCWPVQGTPRGKKRLPRNTVIDSYWLPSIRAAIDLNRNDPSGAIEELHLAAQYEFGFPNPEVEVSSFLYPAYLRGQAYLRLKKWPEAEAEFRKFSDHRGIVVNSLLVPLSQLGLARAYLSAGDTEKSRALYQALSETWQHADADVTVVRQARLELTSLR